MYQDTDRVKTDLHAKFDEGMNDLDTPTPNSRQLRIALGRKLPEDVTGSLAPTNLDLEVHSSPFLSFIDIELPVKCSSYYLGLIISECEKRGMGCISNVIPGTTSAGMKGWQKKHIGDFIIQINDTPVFSKEDI